MKMLRTKYDTFSILNAIFKIILGFFELLLALISIIYGWKYINILAKMWESEKVNVQLIWNNVNRFDFSPSVAESWGLVVLRFIGESIAIPCLGIIIIGACYGLVGLIERTLNFLSINEKLTKA